MASNVVFLCYSWGWDYEGLVSCALSWPIFHLFILLNSDVSVFVLSYLTFIDYYHVEAHLFSKKKQGVNQDEREMEEELNELG